MEKNKIGNRSKCKSETLPSCKKKADVSPRRQTANRKKNNGLWEERSPPYKQTTLDWFIKKQQSSPERTKSPDSVVQTNFRRSPRNHELKERMKKQAKQTVKEPINKDLEHSLNKEPSKQALKIAAKKAMRETTLKAMKHTTKSALTEQSNSIVKDQPSNNKMMKTNQNAKEEMDSLYFSPSRKLDKLVPKVEDILLSMEKENKFKQIQELIDKSSHKFINNLPEKKVDENEKNERNKVYNCKHLTQKNLERMFQKNVEFLDNIFHGKVYNERHELFQQGSLLNNFTDNDLRVNETTSVFTDEQLIYIVSLFRNRYDNGNIYKYSDYYFKVLLPEFCLKTFMDYHYQFKKKETAMEYLKSLPVPKIV